MERGTHTSGGGITLVTEAKGRGMGLGSPDELLRIPGLLAESWGIKEDTCKPFMLAIGLQSSLAPILDNLTFLFCPLS